GCIRPVQVLDHEENGRTCQTALEECPHSKLDLAHELLGLDLDLPNLHRAESEDVVERGQKLRTFRWRYPELGDACRQLLSRLWCTIFRGDAVGAAQDRTKRAEVLFAERRAGGASHYH